MVITCIQCRKPAKVLKGFADYGKKFCSLRCAAAHGFGQTIDLHFCSEEGEWSDGPGEYCETCQRTKGEEAE